ncbi:MAG: hypothetical protein HY461_01705 [Parcubacteria group bacterium]|nr:hypothetical protein [Parcubacteria group bacterium]
MMFWFQLLRLYGVLRGTWREYWYGDQSTTSELVVDGHVLPLTTFATGARLLFIGQVEGMGPPNLQLGSGHQPAHQWIKLQDLLLFCPGRWAYSYDINHEGQMGHRLTLGSWQDQRDVLRLLPGLQLELPYVALRTDRHEDLCQLSTRSADGELETQEMERDALWPAGTWIVVRRRTAQPDRSVYVPRGGYTAT